MGARANTSVSRTIMSQFTSANRNSLRKAGSRVFPRVALSLGLAKAYRAQKKKNQALVSSFGCLGNSALNFLCLRRSTPCSRE